MSGTKEIKRRIKSVKNTKKITKAMELVAASKMKRAVSSTLASRLYAEYSWEILNSISRNTEILNNPFFTEFISKESQEKEKSKILILCITSNRGLCGAYNAQIIKKVLNLIKKSEVYDLEIICLGKKGDLVMRRLRQKIIATFNDLPTDISLIDIVPIAKLIFDEYKSGKYKKVFVAYTDFVSALTQKPNIKQLLPISKTELKDLIENIENIYDKNSDEEKLNKLKIDYLFEGSKEELINSLAEKLTKMQIYQMILESNASEQSARMMAMKNASEASGEMINDLTLEFNKARQSNITREISEISAGMASVT